MTIDDQITLFYRKIREEQSNSRIDSNEALDRINGGRRRVALKTRFYNFTDNVTAIGGESYFTLKDDFHPAEVKDWASIDGKPVTMKDKADWVTKTNGFILQLLSPWERWGMIDGNTFYVYPPAVAGEFFEWRGYGVPPPLPEISGADIYTNDAQAECCVLDAAIETLEDLGGTPGPVLVKQYNDGIKELKKRASRGDGPRLENAPDMSQ